MKCKNQYGWQEVLTCKQRWMTGSSRSRNPRWLNFLWSYFKQAELSEKFKVKCLTSDSTNVSISLHTFEQYTWKNQSFFFKLMSNFMNIQVELSLIVDHVTWPCDLTMWTPRSTWAAGHGTWTMCFLLWAEHVDSLLGIEESHCHTHFAYFPW